MIRKVRNQVVQHPVADWLLALAVVGSHVAVVWATGRGDWLRTTSFANRLSLYTDLIAVIGILAGFSIAGLASYLAFAGAQIDALRKVAGQQILRQWLASIAGPVLAIGALVGCKIVDREETAAAGARWVAEGAMALTIARVARLFYIFTQLVQISTLTPESGRRRPSAPIRTRPPGSSPRT